MSGDHDFAHVRVLAGTTSAGKPAFEVLPARVLGEEEYEILGSPGLTYGFAAGDRLRLREDGTFDVLERGGNLCLQFFPTGYTADDAMAALQEAFGALGGLVEAPGDRRFIVATVPEEAGRPVIERAAAEWAAGRDCAWEIGNA